MTARKAQSGPHWQDCERGEHWDACFSRAPWAPDPLQAILVANA